MEAERFAKGYEQFPIQPDLPADTEVQATRRGLVEPALRWLPVFSHFVDSHLTGRPLDPVATRDTLDLYTDPTNQQLLEQTSKTVRGLALRHSSLSYRLNQLNFHTLNYDMAPFWTRLAHPEVSPSIDYIDLTVIQAKLSVRGLALANARALAHMHISETKEGTTEAFEAFDGSMVGQITEVDAGITLLEMLKLKPADERENFVLVPGPPKYETGTDNNADFLLFDVKERLAHGIQVKTQYNPKYHEQVARSPYVSILNGVSDLANYDLLFPDGGALYPRPVPGLIAADFILNNEGLRDFNTFEKIDGLRGSAGAILRAKIIAEAFQPYLEKRPPHRAEHAAEKIHDRIMSDLTNIPDDSYGDDAEVPIQPGPVML